MKFIFVRFKSLSLALAVLFSFSAKSESFGLLMKPYVGLDYAGRVAVDGTSLKSQNCSISSDLTGFENFGATAGLRIHRNVGVEYKYIKLARQDNKNVNVDYNVHSADLLFYIPAFDVMATSFEFVAGGGAANVSALSYSDSVPKIHLGLETRVLGWCRLFVGYERLINVKLGTEENNIDILKFGVSYFFW